VERIIEKAKPKLTILTHFSVQMLRYTPFKIAKEMSDRTGLKVIAAYDGLKVDF
jgi:phosphoribosyl 1,2-cyclic phosphodiesterase